LYSVCIQAQLYHSYTYNTSTILFVWKTILREVRGTAESSHASIWEFLVVIKVIPQAIVIFQIKYIAFDGVLHSGCL